jgi:peptide/nickel transport system substrate-binding protein
MRSALTAAVLVGLWSGLWAGGAAHADEVPKRGGTLNFAVVAEPPTTDCHATTTFAMVHPVAPQYSTLLAFVGPHDKLKIEGDLAQSWEVAKDGLSYTFKLRRGVKFHDGSDFTSEDVKTSYERIINPPGRRGLLAQSPAPRHPGDRDARPLHGGV